MKRYTNILIVTLLLTSITSCHDEWLEIKNDKTQVVPKSLQDFQAILDNIDLMNFDSPSLGEVSADDYFISYESYQSLNNGSLLQLRNAYTWSETIYEDNTGVSSWNTPYQMVFAANVTLEGVEKIDPSPTEIGDWNNIKGSALFYRSWAFYQLAQIFCKQYNVNTAGSDKGIPLRLESDINNKSSRASVLETYNQILKDLKDALPLLPDVVAEPSRPGKASTYALLAKTYLQMGEYTLALEASNESLQLYNVLLDYNDLEVTADYPFERFNDETVFYSMMAPSGPISNSILKVIPELVEKYDNNDLRSTAFFYDDNGATRFKGSYDGADFFGMYLFNGIATDEVYLIRAECYARNNETENALKDLNTLLENRYEDGTFIPISISSTDDILIKVLEERRKELIFRGIRWMDLRRLNKDPRFSKTLKRDLNGELFTLPAEDPRYVLPIPKDVIDLSGIEQNPR